MEPILLQTSEADAGTRLDACLARAIEDLTRSAAAKAVEDGRVLVNGKAPNKSYKLTGHEQIEFTPEEPAPIDAVPQDIPLDVVYEDDDVIVVNKPSGLVVHPAPGHPDGTLVNALLYHCGDSLSGVGGALRPGIVHRIDRDTSGLIIAAKNDYAHQFLSAQLGCSRLSFADENHMRDYLSTIPGSVSALDADFLLCHLQHILLAFPCLIQFQHNRAGLFSARNAVSDIVLHSGFLFDSLLQHFRIRIPISQQSAIQYNSAVIAECMFPRQEFYLFWFW